MHEVRRRRALPVYIAALVFALYALFAPLYTLWHFLLAALVTAAAWLIADALIKPAVEYVADPVEPEPSYGEEADAILARARQFRTHTAACGASADGAAEKLAALADISDKIAGKAKEPLTDLARIRRFQGYYLATTEKLADALVRLDAQGVEGENIADARRRILALLDTEQEAFVRFLDGLFGAEAMDIESEIQVMHMRMQAEGLSAQDGPDAGSAEYAAAEDAMRRAAQTDKPETDPKRS